MNRGLRCKQKLQVVFLDPPAATLFQPPPLAPPGQSPNVYGRGHYNDSTFFFFSERALRFNRSSRGPKQ